MSQVNRSYAPPSAKSFPLTIDRTMIGGIATVEIDNGSALTLTVTADGQLIRTVTPYTTRFNVNTGPAWSQVTITANATTIQTTDSLTIVCYDSQVVPPLPPSFGVSAWGGGADYSTLALVNAGDSILAAQIRQFYLALTGSIPVPGPLSINGQVLVFGSLIASSLTSAARISSSHVGLSDQTLLNFVPLNPPVATSASGTGDATKTALTISGLPSSAVAASVLLVASNTSGVVHGMIFRLYRDVTQVAQNVVIQLNTAVGPGIQGFASGAGPCDGSQITYEVTGTGGASWSFTITLLGYWEAA